MKLLAPCASALLGLALLAGCSDKPQGMVSPKGAMQAYQGSQDPFVVPDWKVGDQASWQAQLNKRALAQNEYVRIGTQ
jgi:hypothetical protein